MSNYIDADDLYDVFGLKNVKEWANQEELDVDDDDYDTTIAARITKAATFATNEVNELLRNGPWLIPFTTVPESVKRACVYFGGAWLFEWRRDDGDNDRYSKMESRAREIISEIKSGVRQLDADVQTSRSPRNPYIQKVS